MNSYQALWHKVRHDLGVAMHAMLPAQLQMAPTQFGYLYIDQHSIIRSSLLSLKEGGLRTKVVQAYITVSMANSKDSFIRNQHEGLTQLERWTTLKLPIGEEITIGSSVATEKVYFILSSRET